MARHCYQQENEVTNLSRDKPTDFLWKTRDKAAHLLWESVLP